MKYNLEVLSEYIDKGLVVKQNHPTLPLSIYNYSRTTQYDGMWDDITLNCRGLVLDNEGNVIAKPFPKFFNMEELSDGEIPKESFEVFEKMDGSLGIFFHYGGEFHMATRGSFTSEQAIKGMEIATRNRLYMECVPGFTYLFEIIYPENRIVVDYGDEERLVLLSIVNPEGKELTYDEIKEDGWDIVNRYDGVNDYTKLKEMISNDAEGYVIRFSNGMRMKIKGTEYVRLHRILTNFSNKDIWELLKNGEPLEPFLERVPDEFDKWVKGVVMNLRYSFYSIYERAGKLHDGFRYGKYNDKEVEPTKKEFAEYTKQFPKELSAVMFKMWDKKPYDHLIWSMVKPKYQKPFKNEDN
jgi:RNA ligase